MKLSGLSLDPATGFMPFLFKNTPYMEYMEKVNYSPQGFSRTVKKFSPLHPRSTSFRDFCPESIRAQQPMSSGRKYGKCVYVCVCVCGGGWVQPLP